MALREVENLLSEGVDQVDRGRDRVSIASHSRPAAVIVSADDLASLEETLEVVSDQKLISQIRDSLVEISAGRVETLSKEDIRAGLRS